ncbi:hypothetical protein HMPREF0765_0503 [Sphingobacterium spiritivorum ATCC 33300]|uniref:DUF4407 domain-containing protein n=1 Tax=Sphingobacterium spiritivorum ATCC 33300 TaxID=525372 RepID=C2FT47_SPHSI|nr:DUF4407 domain-containing protein [Sphingobacterium spiritivorum]EEI93881.1 hypothetical protein HMPREF0765_0503 [Sphingobacterium spiritivorum ATCC 33300]QQS94442.1 DUF4407 domain-containing protein [Sphingobacterium spiritivorum]
MGKLHYPNVIKEKSIVSLIGIDYYLLKKSKHNLIKFYISGILIILILFISFFSVFYGFELMFKMWYAELLFSLFFSLMFCNIYVFLIQTFSKEVFPGPKLKFFNLSNISRVGFVLLIGFLIAQPIKIFFLRDQLKIDIRKHKMELYQNFCLTNKNLYISEINKLNLKKKHYMLFGENTSMLNQLTKIEEQLNDINNRIDQANTAAFEKINRSDFFIKRIEIAGRYRLGVLINVLILIIFCAPLLLIYSISGNRGYYQLKKEKDRELVIREYENFKENYTNTFVLKYGLFGVSFYEPYIDPPFNTIRKQNPYYRSQDDFLKQFPND